MPKKTNKLLQTISEISKDLDLPTHVLRFWEKNFIQIKPTKHNNRRYYTQQNLEYIKHIKHLLYHEGYTIKEAQEMIKKTPQKKESNISNHINELLEIRKRLKNINEKIDKTLI